MLTAPVDGTPGNADQIGCFLDPGGSGVGGTGVVACVAGASAIASAAGLPVELGADGLALGKKARAFQGSEILVDQVLVDLDKADLFRGSVHDERLDARPSEIAHGLEAVGAGDKEQEAGVVGVLPEDDRALETPPSYRVGEGGYVFRVDRAEAGRYLDGGKIDRESSARA